MFHKHQSSFICPFSQEHFSTKTFSESNFFLSLKSKTGFLKILEICDLFCKGDLYPPFLFFAYNFLICTSSVELNTDSRYSHLY